MESIYVIPVAAASVLASVLATSYWFCCCCCWAVPLSYVTSGSVCCYCSLVRTLFSSCSLEVLHQYCYPQNSSQKSCKVVFRSSGSLSTPSMISLYAFCVNRISFFLFDTISGFSSVFIPSCVNNRSNSVVQSFGKQLSILSESFSKSYISLIGLLLGT